MNLGTTLDYYNTPFCSSWVWQGRSFYGMAAYARYFINESKFKPFVDGNAGLSIAGDNQDQANQISTYKGGFNGKICGGIYIPSQRKGNFALRGGIDILQASGYIKNNGN